METEDNKPIQEILQNCIVMPLNPYPYENTPTKT